MASSVTEQTSNPLAERALSALDADGVHAGAVLGRIGSLEVRIARNSSPTIAVTRSGRAARSRSSSCTTPHASRATPRTRAS